MPAYEKSTIADVKRRLEEGHYKDVGGANKGIGKMKGLSDAQKTKAKKLAAEHFGVSPDDPKPARKKSAKKKVSKKKTTRKAAAKKTAAKKTTKRRGRPPKAAAAAASSTGTSTKKKRSKKQSKKKLEQGQVHGASLRQQQLFESQTKITSYDQALEALQKAKNLGASSSVAEGAKAAARGLTASINELCLMSGIAPSEGEQKAADVLSKAVEASTTSRGPNGAHGNAAAQPALPTSPTPPVATAPAQS